MIKAKLRQDQQDSEETGLTEESRVAPRCPAWEFPFIQRKNYIGGRAGLVRQNSRLICRHSESLS